MSKSKTKTPAKVKKTFTTEQLQKISAAEDYVDKLIDYLPPEHPRVLDAKQYVKELEAM